MSESRVVAALPGAGWLVEFKVDDDEMFTEPIVCWNVYEDGQVEAMIAMDTWVEPVSGCSNVNRILPPGSPTDG